MIPDCYRGEKKLLCTAISLINPWCPNCLHEVVSSWLYGGFAIALGRVGMAEKGAPRKFSSSPLWVPPWASISVPEGKPNSQSPARHGTGCLSCVKCAWLQKWPPTDCTCFQEKEDLKASGLVLHGARTAFMLDAMFWSRELMQMVSQNSLSEEYNRPY